MSQTMKTAFIGFRCTEAERRDLMRVQRAYGLPSLSETLRRLSRQAIVDRRLDGGNGKEAKDDEER